MPKVLTKLKIDEVSAVDRGAGEGTRIVLAKRDPGAVFRRIFGVETLRDVLNKAEANSSLPRLRDLKDPDEADDGGHKGDDGEEADDDEVTATKHLLSTVADLMVQAGSARDRQSALFRLMHTARGAELMRRLSKQRKEQTTMTYNRSEELMSIAKQYGPVAVAKHIIDNGASISEHEFTAMVDAYAKSKGTTFVKLYTANDDDGLAIRRATQILKGFPVATQVGGAAARDVDDPKDALRQLEELAEKLRAQFPELSKAQAFSKVYTDPKNAALVRAEREANRPRSAA
jgi:hypothetical protein